MVSASIMIIHECLNDHGGCVPPFPPVFSWYMIIKVVVFSTLSLVESLLCAARLPPATAASWESSRSVGRALRDAKPERHRPIGALLLASQASSACAADCACSMSALMSRLMYRPLLGC